MQSVAHTSAEGSVVILGTSRLRERCGFCSRGINTLPRLVAALTNPKVKETKPTFYILINR